MLQKYFLLYFWNNWSKLTFIIIDYFFKGKKKFSEVLDNSVMIEIFKAASNQLPKNLQNKKHENENS